MPLAASQLSKWVVWLLTIRCKTTVFNEALQLFVSGKMAVVFFLNLRCLTSIEEQIGDRFEMVTGFFPSLLVTKGVLPRWR